MKFKKVEKDDRNNIGETEESKEEETNLTDTLSIAISDKSETEKKGSDSKKIKINKVTKDDNSGISIEKQEKKML